MTKPSLVNENNYFLFTFSFQFSKQLVPTNLINYYTSALFISLLRRQSQLKVYILFHFFSIFHSYLDGKLGEMCRVLVL